MTSNLKIEEGAVLKRYAVGVFVFALALRIVIAWKAQYFSNYGHELSREMVRIGLSLIKYHEYGNPYVIYTGPTAQQMPLYPLFLGFVYWVFGVGASAEAVKILSACLATALRWALLPLFCMTAGLGRRAAIISGILGAFYMGALQTELRGNWDGPWQALVLLAVIWMTIKIWNNRFWERGVPPSYFVLWGAAILLQPAFLTVLATFLLAGLIAVPAAARFRYVRQSVLLGLVVLAFLAPWAIRNYFRLGHAVWTRDNFGLEFWLSNGPNRAFDMQTNLGFKVAHPSENVPEAQLVAQLGEVQYNQMRMKQAEAWIAAHPREFLRLTAIRFLAWWFPPSSNGFRRLADLGLSILGLAGLGLMFRVNRSAAWLFLLTWISFPLVYYVVQWSPKYRCPIDWQLVVCAAVAIASALQVVLPERSREPALSEAA